MSRLALFGGSKVIKKPLTNYNEIGSSELKEIKKVIKSGILSGFVASNDDSFFGGPKIKQLEKLWQKKFNVNNAISFNSNTSGIFAAVGAINANPGDEIIVPPYTMSATVIAPLIYGCIPVFADIEDQYFCIDPKKIITKITQRTKAIIAVNLFGHPAELTKLKNICKKRNIFLIEDNAQAPMAIENNKYTGTIGDIGVFSLNRHKHIQTGEGGICVTNNNFLAKKLRLIRNHGECIINQKTSSKMLINNVGFNYRMTELSAAVGICQLKKLNSIVNERIQIAKKILKGLKHLDGIETPLTRNKCKHVYYGLPMKINEKLLGCSRKKFASALRAEGLPINEGYVKPMYELPIFQKKIAFGNKGYPFILSKISYKGNLCPVAKELHYKKELGFGICSFKLNNKEINLIIDAFHKVYEKRKSL